ncbi:MAG: glycoside hydrolase family 116 protein, partial [Acidobacteria bacterium]|nr:glycoside hydrolase family 116 protein [Acidobacteriota bacterium]
YRYNFVEDLREVPSGQRIYALNDEAGLVVCTWPDGKRPAVPFGYCDEVWSGVEYQVAAHLIYEGMTDEALRIVRAVRDRHDGLRRNPWDEAECGHHYARALSSWSLLNAFSGFAYAAPEKSLRFRPAAGAKDFRCFFASGTAWGSYRQQREDGELEASVQVEGGALEIATLRIPAGGRKLRRAPAGAQLSVENGLASIRLSRPARLAGGDQLSIALGG